MRPSRTKVCCCHRQLIARVADLDAKLPAIGPDDYHLAKGARINDATNRAWNRLTTL